MKRLYYLGAPGDGFGWGVANSNLIRELGKLCDVIVDSSDRTRFDAPVFVPVKDSALRPLRKVKAPRVLGYCFTEWPLLAQAERESRCYDVLFAGSTWNVRKLSAAGIEAQPLIQGVDFDRFRPQPPSGRKGFVVFSGGKFEFRKGQDYVIAAMRHFMQFHADVVLITAWHNQWEQSAASMRHSWLIDPADPLAGLPLDRVIQLPSIPNAKFPTIYAQAHVGVFPNRCEAGTNMVMAEFMACGRPVIASNATGQADLFRGWRMEDGGWPYLLTTGSYDPAEWFNPEVSDILTALERAYNHREELREWGSECRRLIERFTWQDCARTIFSAAFPELAAPAAVPPARDRESRALDLASR